MVEGVPDALTVDNRIENRLEKADEVADHEVPRVVLLVERSHLHPTAAALLEDRVWILVNRFEHALRKTVQNNAQLLAGPPEFHTDGELATVQKDNNR